MAVGDIKTFDISYSGLTLKVNAVDMGELALKTQNIEPGTPVDVSGFLARRSLRSTQLVLHINTIERIT